MSKIMIASAKMRCFKLRGGGDELRGGGDDDDPQEDKDDIVICNAHMHALTTQTRLIQGSTKYKDFWDDLAKYLVYFQVRYLCGNFNEALFCVVPELRARGFQINIAAWY